jgi:hypothetical protein
MAIRTDQMVYQGAPAGAALQPFKLDFGGEMSMERERLKLMREQFENTKQQQQRAEALAKLEEEGRMARERMQAERAKEQQNAARDAVTLVAKREAYAKFAELNGKGDIEEARSLVPYMNSLGMQVDLEGEDGGLPRYRIHMSEQDALKAEAGGIGYPGDDSKEMLPPQGIGSTEEAFGKALEASGIAEATGQPARGPDEPDYTGGVPSNVIDTGAQHGSTMSRLNPALSGLVGAYPSEYRDSATQTAGAVAAMGLPLKESLKQFDTARGSPDSLIRADIDAQSKAGEQGVRRAEAAGKQGQDRFKDGYGYGKQISDEFDIKGVIDRRKSVAQARRVIFSSDTADDYLAGATISRMMGERGATTEGDIQRVLGTASMSFLDKIKRGLHGAAIGGLNDTQKNALLGVLKQAEESDAKRTEDFLSNMDEQMDSEDTDPDVRKGMLAYRNLVVPRDLREEYSKKREGKNAPREPGQGNAPRPFSMTDDAAPDMGEVKIPTASRIAFEHNNPGNLKYAGQEGAEQGEEAKSPDGKPAGHWARFVSVDEGLQALRAQVERDAERGLTIRQFVEKYAPKSDNNDTERYVKQALAALRADEGDLLSEVDVYDAVRFVAQKESGTQLPEQYDKPASGVPADADLPGGGFYRGGADTSNDRIQRVGPDTSNDRIERGVADPAARIKQLLDKGGY